MQQLWKRYATAMEKVCRSYEKGMQQQWKSMQQLWKMYAAAMEKVCNNYGKGMPQL